MLCLHFPNLKLLPILPPMLGGQVGSNFKLGKCKQSLYVKAGEIKCFKKRNNTAPPIESRKIPYEANKVSKNLLLLGRIVFNF